MNLMEVLKSQLMSGDTIAKLASLLGISAEKIPAMLSAAVPALLSSLGTAASQPQGAEKLIQGLKQVSDGGLGDLGSVFGGNSTQTIEKGGNILSSILGAGGLGTLVSTLAKFLGSNSALITKLLGALAPYIMGQILNKGFGGKLPTAQGLTSFFGEQKNSLTSALPAGLSLASLTSGATDAVRQTAASAQEAAGGAKWLLPLLGVLLLGALLWWFMNKGNNPTPAPAKGTPPAVKETPVAPAETKTPVVAPAETKTPVVTPPVDKIVWLNPGEITKYQDDLKSVFGDTTKLLDLKDVKGATEALPKLEDQFKKLEGMKDMTQRIPDVARGAVKDMIQKQIGSLNEAAEKVYKITDKDAVTDKLKALMAKFVELLSGWIKGW